MPALAVTADFRAGAAPAATVDVSELLAQLTAAQRELAGWPVERIVAALDRFSATLLDRANPIHRQHPGSGIPFIAQWTARQNITAILDTAFERRECLDGFARLRGRGDREYRAFPRGLAVHWMAGNVPTLGFLSLVVGLATKNANVIKLASGATTLMSGLLEQLSAIEPALAGAAAVIRYDRGERAIGEALSRAADARVFWGSDESVDVLRALPARPTVSDVVFPNRTSFIVIDQASLDRVGVEKLARRVALDVSVFEQKACASPHTVVLLTEQPDAVRAFGEHLHQALGAALRGMPKVTPSEREVAAILSLRAQYDMFHEAWYSTGTEFTILADEHVQLGPAVGHRTIYLRRLADASRLPELIAPNVQSIGLAIDPASYDAVTERLGGAGVYRFATLGTMTNFELPWDGVMLPHHLVRWTSRPTQESA